MKQKEQTVKLQDWYIDANLSDSQKNQIRVEAQRDWELLWDDDFIFAGCNGGVASDQNRLEEIVRAAQRRLEDYKRHVASLNYLDMKR